MRRWQHILSIFLLVLIGGQLSTTPAQAHADYERSDPPAGATIAQAPEQVQVWVTQELFRREGANTLEVYGRESNQVD